MVHFNREGGGGGGEEDKTLEGRLKIKNCLIPKMTKIIPWIL